MRNPWQLYDELIEAIPDDVTVTAADAGPRWNRVRSSAGGMGMAYAFGQGSRPAMRTEPLTGAPLREIAALAKSWNFAEAGIGVAAINAWHSHPGLARTNGFTPCTENNWGRIFHAYSEAVAGEVVSVIGHFPFAPEPLAQAAELRVLERNTFEGDYPDSACEYLLGSSDYVFISGSALINKTMPRLLRLARHATTVVLGPSTPASPLLFDHGADIVTAFCPSAPAELFDLLDGSAVEGMYDYGYRVERRRD